MKRKDLLEEQNDRREAVTDDFKRPRKYKPFHYTHKWTNDI
jgi:hypothetical protein